jgi:hypothetical protein
MFIFTKKFRKLCIQYPLFLYILVENFTEYILVKNLGQTIETISRIIKKYGAFYFDHPIISINTRIKVQIRLNMRLYR